ncbi:dTDP-4-dehydrorhamnose reductase [Pelistega ratti]|uniref:dTDP-4-dehydrorhamnose reductase n=1 Tax=Pelistega ratti TaxID=2652177 RepID=UPI001356EF2A|nr:dTDP-4-dehydrorhamnose reductase [Pelistega ratti]
MSRWLIIGANGQVGKHLNSVLQSYPIDNLALLAVGRESVDITHTKAVKSLINDFQPTIVINAAAYTNVEQAEHHPEVAEKTNVKGVQNLAEATAQIGACLIHLSSDYVFDGQLKQPYHEEDLTNPLNQYGKTKLAGELIVKSINPRHIILRTSWVFSEQGHNFVKTILRLAKEKETLQIVADQIGAPTYAGDIAQVLVQIALQIQEGREDVFGLYHFSGFPYISWYLFAQFILAQTQQQKILSKLPTLLPISSKEYASIVKRPLNTCLAMDKIKRTFAIEPSDWQKALVKLHPYIE